MRSLKGISNRVCCWINQGFLPLQKKVTIPCMLGMISTRRRHLGTCRQCQEWPGTHGPMDEFHHINPQWSSPTNNIRRLTNRECHDMTRIMKSKDISQEGYPRIHNEETGIHGEGYIWPKPLVNLDVIIPLTPTHTDHLLYQMSNDRSSLPSKTQCVWIYETAIVRIDKKHIPEALYQLQMAHLKVLWLLTSRSDSVCTHMVNMWLWTSLLTCLDTWHQ